MKTMKHWIEKDGEVIAIFEKEEYAATFLESMTGFKRNIFKDTMDFYKIAFKLGYEQHIGEAEINL